MTRAWLDPTYSPHERRWAGYLAAALWLVSASLLVGLAMWAISPAGLG